MPANASRSSLERFLKGKRIPGNNVLVGAVKSIVKRNGDRILTDEYGNKQTLSKQRLLAAFNKTLSASQKQAMMKTIRRTADHRATMMIGGKQQGTRKTYASVAAAKRALVRRYGK